MTVTHELNRISHTTIAVVCAPLLLLVSGGICSAVDVEPATLTIEEIYEGASLSKQLLNSLRVEYVLSTRQLGEHRPAAPQGAQVLIGSGLRTFVFKGERRLSTSDWTGPSAVGDHQVYVFDGVNGFSYSTGSLIMSDGKDPKTDGDEYYCNEMLDIPVSDSQRANYDNSWSYPHCLRGVRKDFTVLANQEQVDGAWCHVVKCAGHQKLWIDPKIGFAVRKKEMYRQQLSSSDGGEPDLFVTYSFSKFTEPVKGLWLPNLCQRVTYSDVRLKPELELQVEVKSLAVNRVTDKDFDFEVPSGTLVFGIGKGLVIRGDKTRLLDLVAGDLAEQSGVSNSTFNWFVLDSLAVFMILVVAFVWRNRRQKPG